MEYGQTPWDDMGADELRLEVWRLFKAAENAESCLLMAKQATEYQLGDAGPYWSDQGSGGRALNMLNEAMHVRDELSEDDRESLWKDFFRNALPLLFKNLDGWKWMVCEKCQQWTTGNQCMCGNTELRPIRWEDFRNK